MSRQIKDFMTSHPHSIGSDQSLEKAQQMLREFKIRHLPVLRGGSIIGIITDRDVKLCVGLLNEKEKHEVTVGDICTDEPYTIGPDHLLKDVAKAMSEHRYGSALVKDSKGHLVGIFTMVDACRVLASTL